MAHWCSLVRMAVSLWFCEDVEWSFMVEWRGDRMALGHLGHLSFSLLSWGCLDSVVEP